MKSVSKYNICKIVSIVLTMGTPIVTLSLCGSFFKETPTRSVSAAGMFTLFITLLLFKDKILKNWKMPSAFVLSVICLVLITMVKGIIEPVQYVCIATCVSTGIDELTFKHFCNRILSSLNANYVDYMKFGLLFCKSDKVM